MVGLDNATAPMSEEKIVEHKIIDSMACVLEQHARFNEKHVPTTFTVFHSTRPPTVPIKSYIERIHKYTNVSSGCLVAASCYIDRFIQANPDIVLCGLNVHRLIITSIVISMKFLDDLYYNNAYYAKVGGLPAPEMNALELEFLFRLNFKLHVSPPEYESYEQNLLLHSSAINTGACSCGKATEEGSFVIVPQQQIECPPAKKVASTRAAQEAYWQQCGA
jgi:hypothetical protein